MYPGIRVVVVMSLLVTACSKSKPDCLGSAVACGGDCVELSSDNRNCGACGTSCAPGLVCSAGACSLTCTVGLVECGGACTDPKTDRGHCGASATCSGLAAGAACPEGELCSNGTCRLTCQPDLLNCAGKCIDPSSDRNHCGASADCAGSNAGQVCTPGTICSGGACGLSCQAGLMDCGGTCVDPRTDRAHCGATGPACTGGLVCAAGEVCQDGQCRTSCPAGEIACGGRCVDPGSDPLYCGATATCEGGSVCRANQACYQGACGDISCAWRSLLFAPLASLPAGATFTNLGNGAQGPAVACGRTAWLQTAGWNWLTIPMPLASQDDAFAVQVDLYLPAFTDYQRDAYLFMFNDPSTPNGFGSHGVAAHINSVASSVTNLDWWLSPSPAGAWARSLALSFDAGQWHVVRVQGRRSTCTFRLFIDGLESDGLTASCDLAGGSLSLSSSSASAQATEVAWANLWILRGEGPNCQP